MVEPTPASQFVTCTAFQDQKPGTSGLRKKVKVFQQPHYTELFIQAILQVALPPDASETVLVVGGDGRYFCPEVVHKIIAICAANGVGKLVIGVDGILSTPAVSNLIRKRKALGGIVLTASHNPGGPNADFGIKYNVSNGGPAPEQVTDKIYQLSKTLTGYRQRHMHALESMKLSQPGEFTVETGLASGKLIVEIVDSVQDYVELMKEIFDFNLIRNFLRSRPDFKLLFDGMHGVTGPYGTRIFCQELGMPASSVMNAKPLPDFGGGHPDPNLTYAHELVERVRKERIDFGAASDGDGDRNMIISHDAFVNPSDSVAIIAAHSKAIPYFKKTGLNGLARSMPTSMAIDRVASEIGCQVYEVPTGWKFFGNLMDAGKLSVCGEESFGTGSDHIREKDGLWAILAWLNILASQSLQTGTVSVKQILQRHYSQFGRNFFTRYDYEEVESLPAKQMMDHLQTLTTTESKFVGSCPGSDGQYVVRLCDNFSYTDPIDGSVSLNQGIHIIFENESRIIVRLSGTGSSGATVRLYVERFSDDPALFDADAQQVLKPLVKLALTICRLEEFTGRKEPTVIT